MIFKKFLGLIDLFRAQTLYIHKVAKIVVVGKYKNFILVNF